MADLILPARFNSQPQYRAVVDAGNPITRGLVYAYNPAAGLIDLAGNQANNGFTGTYSLSGMPPNERGIYFDGASYFKVTRNAGYVATSSSPHTMLALCRPTGAGKYMVPVALGEVTDSNYTSAIQIDTASGWLAHKIDSPAAVSTLTTPADTNLCLAVAVRGAADRTFAKNGQLQVNTTSIGGGATAGGMVIGNHFRNSSPEAVQYFVGWIGLVLVWNRTLTDAELHSITVNPWQIFKAPTPRLWPRDSASTSYSLTVDAGSYALTGQATGVRASRTLAAAQGSYTLTGQATGLLRRYPLIAAQGSYALTGQATGLRASRALAAAQGSYALTGQAAGLLRGLKLTAEQGSYTLTGQATGLRIARLIAAAQGSYGLTGQDVTLTYSGSGNKLLAAGQGSYALTGQDVGLLASRKLTAEQGSYALTGQNVGLLRARLISLSAGGYTLTGQPANLLRALRLTAAQGSYTINGQTVALSYSGAVASYSLTAAFGLYTLTGQTVSLTLTIPVYSPTTRPHYTVTPGATRLGYAAEAVQTGRLGHSNERIAAKRLGARTK